MHQSSTLPGGVAAGQPRRTQVDQHGGDLSVNLDKLGSLLNTLRDRLIPVVRPAGKAEGQIGAGGPAQLPEPTLVPLAESLRTNARHTESMIGLVQSILEGLEI